MFNFELKKTNKRGFTLIELLVVISIIGLLSSIVLVSTKNAREKAEIAKVLNFSAQVHHAIGDMVVGEWEFENNLNNTFGEANSGTYLPSGETPVYEDGAVGKALVFNGLGNRVIIPNSSALEPRDDLGITIEVWLKFNSLNTQFIIGRKEHYSLYLLSEKLHFIFDARTNCDPRMTVNRLIEIGKWYNIIITFIPETQNRQIIKIYLNGQEVFSETYNHNLCRRYDFGSYPPSSYTDPISIGGTTIYNYYPLNALIERVRIYNVPITGEYDIY